MLIKSDIEKYLQGILTIDLETVDQFLENTRNKLDIGINILEDISHCKKMNLKNLELNGNLVLAPMSDVTNLPFRLLCRKYGASLCYTEMVSSEATVRHSNGSISRGITCDEDRPLGIQLMGSNTQTLVDSAIILEEIHKPELFDINIGCPSQKIIENGCGASLLKNPALIREIIQELCANVKVPVTAKMRILNNLDETLNIARIIEKAGAIAITVHGRTQRQGYSGKSNLEFIKAISDEISIPLIANGDIFDEISASHVLENTQCSGLMIGRAAIGNPSIFRRIAHYLDTGEILLPRNITEKLNDFFEYVELCRKLGMITYADIKLNAQWFIKNSENIKPVRVKINQAKDIDSIIDIMKGLQDSSRSLS
jgi:nifR3 family TIM-barrel protein